MTCYGYGWPNACKGHVYLRFLKLKVVDPSREILWGFYENPALAGQRSATGVQCLAEDKLLKPQVHHTKLFTSCDCCWQHNSYMSAVLPIHSFNPPPPFICGKQCRYYLNKLWQRTQGHSFVPLLIWPICQSSKESSQFLEVSCCDAHFQCRWPKSCGKTMDPLVSYL